MTKPPIISCQLAFHPFSCSYLKVIEQVLAEFDPGPLEMQIGLMSSTLIGPEELVWQKIRELYDLAWKQRLPFKLELSISNCCVNAQEECSIIPIVTID